MTDAVDDARTESVREIVGKVVMDVNELKTRMALITQSQSEHQIKVAEFMLRNDHGREEMNQKLDRLIKSDDQWAGARKAVTIGSKVLMGFVAIVGTWIAYLNVKPNH